MNNNQFRKQEFEKRRVFKKGTSLCNAYSCPIFQNCLLEIKQLQQENARLKDKIDKAIEYIKNIDKFEETLNDDTRIYMIQDVDVDEIERILKEN